MSPKFSGGVSVNKVKDKCTPYLRISAGPLRDTYVHVLVMEAKLGRKLEPWETVERLDGDGLNPSPDNLIVVTRSENTALMNQRRVLERGVPFMIEDLCDASD